MENKNLNAKELELIKELLLMVNSKVEYDLLQAEKARLLSFSYKILKGGN